MFLTFYTDKPTTTMSLIAPKWLTLVVCALLTACNQTPPTQSDPLDKRAAHSAPKAGRHIDGTFDLKDPINIVSPDWGNAATLTAMGYPPIATGDVRVWDRWVGTPVLPSSTIDLGIRYQPNAELIAQLPVDLVVDNFFYEHARDLYGDVPAESVMFAAASDTATWADYTGPTRKLGELANSATLAESYITKSQKDINLAGKRLRQRYPQVNKFAVVQFADANNMRMFVANSLFQPALRQMDQELAVLGKGNKWGFVPIRMADLAQLDKNTCLLIIAPMSPITRAEIERSLVWQRLGYGDVRCVGELPPVWMYGGMSSLVGLADNLSTVVLRGGPAS